MLKRSTTRMALCAAVATAFALTLAANPASARVSNLMSVINGGQENPPIDSSALGNAFLTYDTETNLLCYAISYTTLSAAEIAAHFHGPASAGANAGVLFSISPSPSPFGSPKADCVGPLDGDQQRALLRGQFYINIHSSDAPGGEIRGQVIRVQGR